MRRLALIIVAMVLFFSLCYVVAERQGWTAPAFVEAHLTALHRSPYGQAIVATTVVVLLVSDIALPIPASLVMAAAGKLLGAVVGGLAAVVGAMLAAAVGYYACRWGGQRVFRRLVGDHDVSRVSAWFQRYGVYAIILSRPVPMLPEILSCLAGLAGFRAATFFLAALLGTVPICLVFSVVGSLGDVTNPWPAVWVALVLPAAGWFLVRRLTGPAPAVAPPDRTEAK